MKYNIDPLDDFSIGHNNMQNMFWVHAHFEHELYYLKRGEACYFIEDRLFSIHEGAFVFIPKGVLHRTQYFTSREVERFLIKVDSDFFEPKHLTPLFKTLQKRPVQYVDNKNLPIFEELFDKIRSLPSPATENSRILRRIYIAEVLALLCEMSLTDSDVSHNTDDSLIASVQDYVNQNHSKTITLSQLSMYFSVSEEHLSRKFKQKTGVCISEFINFQRVSHAAELLKRKSATVTDVATECGFNDSNYFSTVFKKYMGITPKKYSMQHKNK
ncbi:MAG: helix-turn-helix domain-containing protein [Clostridia bacterium]|nr:helix-turn-helix domain-containing protein [Clostridia bacterium]